MDFSRPVLLDTNVLIDVISGRFDVEAFAKIELMYVSAVSVAEVFALAGMSTKEESEINTFLKGIDVVPLSERIARSAGGMSRTRRKLTPDIMIAATAIALGVPVVTRDVKGFRNIPGLAVVPMR